MKKIASMLATVISTFAVTTLPALAHHTSKFHAHPHGTNIAQIDTTILLIWIGVVVTMMIGFGLLISSKMKQQKSKDEN